jgi:DNA-binding transcriptional regulator YhcF (GntR family)
MNYADSQSIFIQIADRICDRVLSGEYGAEDHIPSVRELAVEMGVNPNTAMRSFERLQQHGVIYNKRGIGYFISPTARGKIRKMRNAHFTDQVLPQVFREMELLGVGLDEFSAAYEKYLSKNKEKKI